MSDETTTTGHSETIEKARRLKETVANQGNYTRPSYPGLEDHNYVQLGTWPSYDENGNWQANDPRRPQHMRLARKDQAEAIAAIPDLLAALVALADERDALRARVAELEGERDGLRAAFLDGAAYIVTFTERRVYTPDIHSAYLMVDEVVKDGLSVYTDWADHQARIAAWVEETARKNNIPANRVFAQVIKP